MSSDEVFLFWTRSCMPVLTLTGHPNRQQQAETVSAVSACVLHSPVQSPEHLEMKNQLVTALKLYSNI